MKYATSDIIICYMLGISTLKNRRICLLEEIEEYKKLLVNEKNIEVDEKNSVRGLSNLLYIGDEYIMMYPWIERKELVEKHEFQNPLSLQTLCDTNLILNVNVIDEEKLNKLKKIQAESDSKYLQELKEEIINNEKTLRLINNRLNKSS